MARSAETDMDDSEADRREASGNPGSSRGGQRPGAGRKVSRWGKLIPRYARVNQEMIDYCEMRGEGDFSEGIRIAIAESMAAYRYFDRDQ